MPEVHEINGEKARAPLPRAAVLKKMRLFMVWKFNCVIEPVKIGHG